MSKHIVYIAWIIWLFCQSAAAQNSISEKHKTSLNGTWAFRIDPNNMGETEGWFRKEYSTAGWDKMPVPGNWDLRNEYARYTGKAWYRRPFSIAADQQGKR